MHNIIRSLRLLLCCIVFLPPLVLYSVYLSATGMTGEEIMARLRDLKTAPKE